MSISATALYNEMVDEFGLGSGNDQMKQRFISAVNRSLAKMNADLAGQSTVSLINGISETIGLDQAYEYILYAGVKYHMIRMGQSGSDPRTAAVQYKDSANVWTLALGDYQAGIFNALQSDSTSDMVGLGNVTS